MNNMCALRPLPGTILVAQPLIFSLLTLDLPSEVQTWHSWCKRHTGTRASSPTSQRDQNRRGYKIRHHTRLPPNTPSIQEYTYMQMPQSLYTHTYTHVNHMPIVRVLTLWIWYALSTVSPSPSFHPAISLLILHRWGDTGHWSPEETQGHTWGTERGLRRRRHRSVRVIIYSSAKAPIVLSCLMNC